MAIGNSSLARKQIFIPASQPQEAISLRVAAYCRVSTDSDDQLNSFAAQNNYFNTLIAGHDNWALVDIYADEGITGTSAAKRPDFQRLLADCRKGRIDKVLAKSISRFARNTKECLEVLRELKALGIGVYFEEQHIDTKVVSSEMLTAVVAACAQAESESISKNMRWSYQKRMEQGAYIPSSVPYGYRLENREMIIDTQEARIVCEIFEAYLSGASKLAIANDLNRRGIRTRNGNNWDYCAIRYILKNERYIGDSLWQKSFSTESLPPKKVRNYGQRQQYYAEATHPPIIAKEVFVAAQNLLQKRREFNKPGSSDRIDPFGSIMRCGCCGSRFRRKLVDNRVYLTCKLHNSDSTACKIKAVPAEEISAAFLRLYYNLKHYGEPIFSDLIDNFYAVRSRQMLWSQDVIAVNKQISDITSQSHALTLLNQQGLVDPDIFISKSNQLAEQLRSAKQAKERLLEREGDEIIRKELCCGLYQ